MQGQKLPVSIRKRARALLNELDSNRLEVVLVPDRQSCGYGNDFRRLRAVQSQNAEWYREFCRLYASSSHPQRRRFDTLIKRQATRRALIRLSEGVNGTVYSERLIRFIESEVPF